MPGFDRTVHEPARLAVLTVLDGTAKADFVFLLRLLGLTQGNLSSHLSKLQAAGLITLTKTAGGIGPRTFAAITDSGKAAVQEHWKKLDELRKLSGDQQAGTGVD
ncbi:transcriptional regulator [Bogoriella caseilytica]|uniref:ArsR family transcriptional regulator n=1 Tax=Bogoriella caseilytica TaxID=56055 RepID=A0A3N2BAS3_9MICO|nr:transcriptional regulator [Bogoriella caseilytica]ROR72376.1 ArsR family transcriptional regulator [Bogoriella caseilytica]